MSRYMGEVGNSTGILDRDGRMIHIGDTLEFDQVEWGSGLPYTFLVEFHGGELSISGTVSDLSEWCRVVKAWDE